MINFTEQDQTRWRYNMDDVIYTNAMKKDLATLASINCTEYSYWKDAQTHEEEELAK